MVIPKKTIPLLFSFLFTSIISAEDKVDDTVLQSLKTYINNQSFESAWALANANKDEYLGDENFDFLYGVAALANNEAEHAVFAFERVVTNKPNWLDAHYLLAKANYKIANYQAVISGGQFLLSHPKTTKKLKQSTTALIDLSQSQLNKQSLYVSQNISLGFGHDSNINSGTNEEDIFLPFLGGSIKLSEESKETSDNYSSLNYQILSSKTLSQRSKIVFSGQANIHQFQQQSTYNRFYGYLSTKYVHQFSLGKASVGAKLTPLWLDGNLYRNKSALTTTFEKKLTQRWIVSLGAELGKTSNKINNNLNTRNHSITMAANYFIGNTKHTLGIDYTNEKSEIQTSNHNSRKLSTINYSTLWLINQTWTASSNIGYQKNDYQAFHPFFLQERDDEMWLASASVQYNHSKVWSYRLHINAQNKKSNVPLFSYQRSDINLTAIVNF